MRGRVRLYSLAALVLVVLGATGVWFSELRLPVLADSQSQKEESATLVQGQQRGPQQQTEETTSSLGEGTEETAKQQPEGRLAEQAQATADTTGDPEKPGSTQEETQQEPSGPELAVEHEAAAEQQAVAEQQTAEQRAAEERAAQRAAEEQYASEATEQAAAETQAAEQAAAEQWAAERAAREQAAQEQAAQEQRWRELAEQRETEERVAAERRAAEQQASEQQAAEEAQPTIPTNTALSLSAPAAGIQNDPVTNSIAKSVLANGAGKIPSTGFPWQPGANTYIAAHVYGYPGTGSWQQFARIPNMSMGDSIYLTDSGGTTYEYRVNEILRVNPTDVWVAQPTGQNIVSLQTCVGPNWSERLVVRGTLVGTSQA